MIDCSLFGLNAGWHHIINLVLHLINTLLLFFLLKAMTNEPFPAFVLAGLFGFHPMHVESVAWIAERKDLLSTCFFFLSMAAYLRFLKDRTGGKYCVLLILYSLGLMSKPMLVTFPFVLILLDIWPLKRVPLIHPSQEKWTADKRKEVYLKILYEKLPLIFLSILSSTITVIVQKFHGAVQPFEYTSFSLRISNAILSYSIYIGKLVYPVNLSILYLHPARIPIETVLLSSFNLIVISLLAKALLRKYPFLAMGWLWYLGTLIPVIGIVQVGAQSMADRYTYIPSIGFFIVVVWGIKALLKGKHYKAYVYAIFVPLILLCFIFLTRMQVSHWRDTKSLFRHATEVTTRNYIAHEVYGNMLYKEKKYFSAIRQYQIVLGLMPNRPSTQNNIGAVLLKIGREMDAVPYFEKALILDSTYLDAKKNLETVKVFLKKMNQKINHIEGEIKMNRSNPDHHKRIGSLLMRVQQYDRAESHFINALKYEPGMSDVMKKLAHLYTETKQYEKALEMLNQIISEDPVDANTCYSIASIHAKMENKKNAIQWFNKAVSNGFNNWGRLRNDPHMMAILP